MLMLKEARAGLLQDMQKFLGLYLNSGVPSSDLQPLSNLVIFLPFSLCSLCNSLLFLEYTRMFLPNSLCICYSQSVGSFTRHLFRWLYAGFCSNITLLEIISPSILKCLYNALTSGYSLSLWTAFSRFFIYYYLMYHLFIKLITFF